MKCCEEGSTQVGVSFLLGTMVESVDGGDLEKVESDIRVLIYIYAGFSLVITALILAYFPRLFSIFIRIIVPKIFLVSHQIPRATQPHKSDCLLQMDSSKFSQFKVLLNKYPPGIF